MTHQNSLIKCVSLLLCDEVVEDKRTNKKSFIGVFDNVNLVSLNELFPRLYIVASITEGKGKVPITIRMVRLNNENLTEEKVFEAKGDAELKDPLSVLDIVFELNKIKFSKEGVHAIQVVSNDHPISERRFKVSVVKRS